jgi:myxalamid-type polyketide synthase MxaB
VRVLEPALALEALGELIARGVSGVIGVLDVDWPRIARQAGARPAAPLQLLVAAEAASAEATASGEATAAPAYVALLAGTPAAERPRLLRRFVQEQLAKVMGMGDADQIDSGEPLFNLGLDSLMALELMVLLETNLGIRLTESLVFEHPTIDDLTAYFLAELFPDARADTPLVEAAAAPPAELIAPAWAERVEQVSSLDDDELLRQLRGEG